MPRRQTRGTRPLPVLLVIALLFATLLAGGCAALPSGGSRVGQDDQGAERASLASVSAGRGPHCLSSGVAVHVGRARFLTAAHLVDGTQALLHGCSRTAQPGSATLRFAGSAFPAEMLRAGQADLGAGIGTFYVGGRDVALLRGPAMPPGAAFIGLCAAPLLPGQAVEVVTPRRHAPTRILDLVHEADPIHGFYAELPLPLEPGESGGAVIDPMAQCLAGLVSHRLDPSGRSGAASRTRIVPAAVLRAFLGE
ncbi:hypothetical protein ACFOD4_18275 [Pseudoroseomonas globiformis]|uniref:Serine protease n=1 Tax=Teichococcus globiformis TaxID=2307229 RepID=A0ABV7G584_9PROT